MYKRYYDGYGVSKSRRDAGEIVIPKSAEDTYVPQTPSESRNESIECVNSGLPSEKCEKSNGLLSFMGETDDVILIGLLLFLIWDADNSDPVLLIIIGFLLFSDMF